MFLSCNQRIVFFLLVATVLLVSVWQYNNHFVRLSTKTTTDRQIPDALSTNELLMASCNLFKTSAVPEVRYKAALQCHEQLIRYLRNDRHSLTFDHVVELLGHPNLSSKKHELCYIVYVDNVPYIFRVIAKRPGKVQEIIFNTGVDI